MRITSNMMMNNYLNTLSSNLSSMTEYQKQSASGKRIDSLSDDPVGLISVMSCNVKLAQNSDYGDSLDSALAWLKQTDTSAYQLNELAQSAYETLIQVTNDSYTGGDKAAAAEYIGQLRDQALTIANAQSSDKYIFGGYNVNKPPFTVDGSGKVLYNGLDLTDTTNADLVTKSTQSIQYEIGPGIKMDISITGTELMGMGEDNLYTTLDDLYNALKSNASADELGGYITKLQNGQSNALSVESKVGGMINRLELMQNRYEEETLDIKELKSNVEDVDIAEAYMNYSMAKTVYDAALKIGTQIIQNTVLDYLK